MSYVLRLTKRETDPRTSTYKLYSIVLSFLRPKSQIDSLVSQDVKQTHKEEPLTISCLTQSLLK